ncbi:MAG: energy transducer TonB, partial [Capnocytophaga sp.]|nr:energy transducer TonB [Capnocytophaga sp.]
MSGKERAFVITLVIMLCMVVSFIIIRVNNKPEEIWVEIPPAEEIAKLLEEEKLPQDSQEENSVTDNTPVTTRSYNEADSRIK